MFFVPKIAMPHLIAALEAEIEQEKDVAAWIAEDDWIEDDDWPDGYDPNDLPLFDIVLRTLKEAQASQVEEIDLSGKPFAFMVFPLPAYLQSVGPALTADERQALEDVRERHSAFQRETTLRYLRRGDRPFNVPSHWVRSPTTSSEGFRWDDPDNPGNSVRIFHGDPTDEDPAHRGPFVIVVSDGRVLDRNGDPLADRTAVVEALRHF